MRSNPGYGAASQGLMSAVRSMSQLGMSVDVLRREGDVQVLVVN